MMSGNQRKPSYYNRRRSPNSLVDRSVTQDEPEGGRAFMLSSGLHVAAALNAQRR